MLISHIIKDKTGQKPKMVGIVTLIVAGLFESTKNMMSDMMVTTMTRTPEKRPRCACEQSTEKW